MFDRGILIDVSRLIWRLWRGGMPTGVDRVCLAYAEHFRGSAQAVVHRRGRFFVLAPRHSELLFDLFARGPDGFRSAFARLAPVAFMAAHQRCPKEGLLYLNVGHTGLDERTLSDWIANNRIRAIFLIHDLIPVMHPEYCRPGEQAKHRQRIQNVLSCAHGLIGNSQATLDDLSAFATAHQMTMPPAIAARIAGNRFPSTIVPRQFDRVHFVTVGTIEGRKNHSLLLHIWKRLVAKLGSDAPLLVIVGQRGWEANEAIAMLDRAPDLEGYILEYGKCSDRELANLVAGAQALLMPSFAEGFGLPVAEALQLGTPVIASDLPVFREFAHEIPTYIDPLDGTEWEKAILSFAENSAERCRQLQVMQGYRAPDWQSHFERVERWIQTLPQ